MSKIDLTKGWELVRFKDFNIPEVLDMLCDSMLRANIVGGYEISEGNSAIIFVGRHKFRLAISNTGLTGGHIHTYVKTVNDS